jgi:serralysin
VLKTLALRCAPVAAVGLALAGTAVPTAQADFVPLKNAAMIQKLKHGYRWTSGQQSGHLTITRVSGGIKFRETHGTREIRRLPSSCHRVGAGRGVTAVCRVSASAGNPVKLEIVPRLGNDVVDGRTLSAAFKLSVLADAGNDVVHGGAGNDFVNGAFGVDRVYGGAGNDWLRTGDADDHVFGGPGNDRVVGVDGNDEVRGGSGNDLVQGGNGGDAVHGDSGKDTVSCGNGSDAGYGDRADTIRACERVSRRG